MIQRVQTIFLLVIILLGVSFSFLPIIDFTHDGVVYIMRAYKTVLAENSTEVISRNMGVGTLQGLILITSTVITLLFKNRQMQIKLAKLNILLIALQIAAIVLYSDVAKESISQDVDAISIGYRLGSVIPLFSLILTYLSIRFIKRDDNLVKAADRLR